MTERSPQPGRQTGGGRRHLSGPHAAAAPARRRPACPSSRPAAVTFPVTPPSRRCRLPPHSSDVATSIGSGPGRAGRAASAGGGRRRRRRPGGGGAAQARPGREGAPAPPPHRGTTAPSVPRGTPGQPWRPERPAASGSCSPAPPPLRRASDALQRTRACRSSGPGAWIRAPSLHGRRQPAAARPPRSVSASRAPLPQLPRSENNSRKGPGSSPPRHVCGTQRRGRQHRRDRDGAAPRGAPTRC